MTAKIHTILVLDDDPDIGTMIRIMLQYKGYEVYLADRADKAAELLRNHQFDLMIMDMLLSGVNGTDICETMKKDPATAHIPIIMISAHPNAKQVIMAAGADDFIAKPFDMQDLFSKIETLLNHQPQS
jgi:DNA-binding response OmpR family regulator